MNESQEGDLNVRNKKKVDDIRANERAKMMKEVKGGVTVGNIIPCKGFLCDVVKSERR